jgi:membrane-anchored protein YejM (alkaline phosphatase superfamily)
MGCGATPTIVMAPQNKQHTMLCPDCIDAQAKGACPPDPSCGRANGCADVTLGLPLFHNHTIVQQPLDLDTTSDQYGDAAEKFIADSAASGEPFFLYYANSHMHVPQNHHARWDNQSTTPWATRENGGREFAASLLEMDNEVGRVMVALTKAKVDENTLVLVTGDNG